MTLFLTSFFRGFTSSDRLLLIVGNTKRYIQIGRVVPKMSASSIKQTNSSALYVSNLEYKFCHALHELNSEDYFSYTKILMHTHGVKLNILKLYEYELNEVYKQNYVMLKLFPTTPHCFKLIKINRLET